MHPQIETQLRELAARHGLSLKEGISFNEMGLDYRIAFAADTEAREWVLRIPRRPDLWSKIQREEKILSLVRQHLSIAVPDWKVVSPEFIAYPKLVEPTVLTYDPQTYEVTWNVAKDAPEMAASLGQVLVALHRIPIEEARQRGLPSSTPAESRQQMRSDLERVKGAVGIDSDLERSWVAWLSDDSYWPDFSVFVHGDLYPGHLLADPQGKVVGAIDWSEAQVGDPSIDFTGHLTVFGAPGLEKLVASYQHSGGRTWPRMVEHIQLRGSTQAIKLATYGLDTGNKELVEAARAQLHPNQAP